MRMKNSTKDLLVLVGMAGVGYGIYYFVKHHATSKATSGSNVDTSNVVLPPSASALDSRTQALLKQLIATGKAVTPPQPTINPIPVSGGYTIQ